NTTSTGNYYTYITGGSWELTSSMESAKYKLGGANDKTSKDGGLYTGLYELGTNLTLLPLDYGDTSLVGYWKFDEASGTLYDSSGKGNNGTQSGGVTYGATGKIGNALSFDGIDDYVDVGNKSSLNIIGAITIIALVKPNISTGQQGIIGTYSTNTAYSLYFRHEIGADIGYWVNPDGTNRYSMVGTIDYGSWTQVAITWDGTNLKSYLNGNFLSSSISNNSVSRSFQGVYIGYNTGLGSPKYLSGVLDETRIYNRALSAAEISALYNAINK
ncbi:MAG: LamG domain-containing protein, partial [Candidatus Paceibacterota bacterium]